MSQYSYNIDKQVVEKLPPDKRYNRTIAFVRALMAGIKWAHKNFFTTFYEGSTGSNYAPGIYNYQDEVIYNKKVYSSLINNNSDIPTADTWILIQNDFIGIKERIKYNGAKIVLEYAINKEFGGVFRQPQTPSGNGDTKSDIYITLGEIGGVLFSVGETTGSTVGETSSSGYIGPDYSFNTSSTNFIINMPAVLYAATTEKAIRQFVNKYIPISLTYSINEI